MRSQADLLDKQPLTDERSETPTASGALGDPEYGDADAPRERRGRTAVALTVGIVAALAALTGWLGWQTKTSHDAAAQHAAYIRAARQGAVNLTTIDWQHVESDVTRINDSATGAFYADFSSRSEPFTEVVKKMKSKSVGTVTAAGIEDSSADGARVLVAVSVRTSSSNAPEEQLRAWRLRVSVSKVGNDVKISQVEFVP